MGKKNKKQKQKVVNTENLPNVSICTPTFNRRPFFEGLIQCIKEQDYPRSKLEWVIIDDGTDKIEDLILNEETKALLDLGETWWWESNRLMPIDVFLHHEMKAFRPYLTTFVMKDVTHQFGPMTTLQNLLKKRIKRRGIQLVRKSD